MKKKLKKSLAIAVTSAMVLAYAQVSTATATKEVIPSWVSSEVAAWKENGLLHGDQNGLIQPNQAISKAEFVALVNRVFKYTLTSDKTFSDVPSNAWFAADISKAFASGVLVGDDKGVMQPLNPITREEAAIILSRVFMIAASSSSTSKFIDDSTISVWAKQAVIAMNEAGYINGTAEGQFQPRKTITRAETIKMINNVMGKIVADSALHSNITGKNLVVNTSGGTLANVSLTGNLYITPGVGEGDLTIKSSHIAGTVYVLGGGTHSVVLEDSQINQIVVSKPSSPVRVFMTGTTTVQDVDILSSSLVENGTKNPIENLHVNASAASTVDILGNVSKLEANSGSTINVGEAEIASFNVSQSASGGTINLDTKAAVGTLIVNAATTIKGEGKIADATINADHVVLDKAPTTITLNVEHVKVADKNLTKETINQPTATATPTPTPATTTIPTSGPVTTPGPAQPAAPILTVNDVTNTVAGLTTEMEFKLDSADYVRYNAAIFNALDLRGSHTLLVRIAANAAAGIPAGLVTTLTFTPNPDPGKYTYNDVLTTFNYAGAPSLVKQYLLFQKAQDPTYTHAIENNIIQVPSFTNAKNFVNAEYTVKPSIFASLRGVNTSVLDASRTYLWIGTNDGVTKINLTNNEMTTFTLANGKLLDNHVLLLISDGNIGVFAITDSGVSYIQN